MISDSMAAVIVALAVTYYYMMCNKTRIWRMLGSVLFILIGLSVGTILDTGIGYMLFGVTAIVGGIHLFTDVGELIN